MRHSFMKYAAAATLAAGMTYAQAPAGKMPPGTPYTQEETRPSMRARLDHMAQVLNLTDSQKEQARAIFEKSRESCAPIRQELQQNREKLSAAAKLPNNESNIQKLATEQGRLMGKMVAIRTEARSKFYQMLTPEQRVKSDQMHEQWKQKARERRNSL